MGSGPPRLDAAAPNADRVTGPAAPPLTLTRAVAEIDDPVYYDLNPAYQCRQPQTSRPESAASTGQNRYGTLTNARAKVLRELPSQSNTRWDYQNGDGGALRPGQLAPGEFQRLKDLPSTPFSSSALHDSAQGDRLCPRTYSSDHLL